MEGRETARNKGTSGGKCKGKVHREICGENRGKVRWK